MGFLQSSLLGMSALCTLAARTPDHNNYDVLSDEAKGLQMALGFSLIGGMTCAQQEGDGKPAGVKEVASLLLNVLQLSDANSKDNEMDLKWKIHTMTNEISGASTGAEKRRCARSQLCGQRQRTSKIALKTEIDEFIRSINENMGHAQTFSTEDLKAIELARKTLSARKDLLVLQITQDSVNNNNLRAKHGEEDLYKEELASVQLALVKFLQHGAATPRLVATMATLTERLDHLRARHRCKAQYDWCHNKAATTAFPAPSTPALKTDIWWRSLNPSELNACPAPQHP